MSGGTLPADTKLTSALRRVQLLGEVRYRSQPGAEGDVCAFALAHDAAPITAESPTGRMMAIAPGDMFLGTPGYRESTRWVDGSIPAGGLIPGEDYWLLADCGVVGELGGASPAEQGRLARIRYLGSVCGDRDETLNIRQFAVTGLTEADREMPVHLVLGTSGDVGKTTAGIAILRTLRMKGHATVTALKATGTASFAELATYLDFGAAQAFDCVDFGLPTTYPTGRSGISELFGGALDFCLSLSADALVIECGGDLFGANVPEFLSALRARRSNITITLAAADALGAIGAQRTLAEIGLTVSMVTGPCTDTPTLRERTKALCGIPAINLVRGADPMT